MVLAVVAALLWRGSDAAATASTTAPAAGVPSGTPAASVTPAWTAPDPVSGDVVEGGRVLVSSAHGVRALDLVTGREVWHYSRSNAQLCGVTATTGVAVAIFRTADRCDEVVALNAGTGVRAWTRNVNFSADATLTSTAGIVLAVSPRGLATIDPTGDTLRWRYRAPSGCRILDAAAGRSGVALLQRCDASAPVQLRLLDGFVGSPHWSRDLPGSVGSPVRLLGADQLVGVTVGDSARFLAGTDGSPQGSLRLPEGAAQHAVQSSAGSTVFLWAAGTLTAFDDTNADVRWSTPALGLPADAAAAATKTVVLVPQGDGFVQRDATTGAAGARFAVADLPGPGTAAQVGTTVVYRLARQVLGYR